VSDGVKIRLSIAAKVCLSDGSLRDADLFFAFGRAARVWWFSSQSRRYQITR